jgi:hypothetical protein
VEIPTATTIEQPLVIEVILEVEGSEGVSARRLSQDAEVVEKPAEVKVEGVSECLGYNPRPWGSGVEVGAPLKAKSEGSPPIPPPSAKDGPARKQRDRQITVRYYKQMSAGSVYPLIVAITKDAVQAIIEKAVDQSNGAISVAVETVVEIEPILPGCPGSPRSQRVRIGRDDVKAIFYVAPSILGTVEGAHVIVRDQHHVLVDIPLSIRVVSQTPAVVLVATTVVFPFMVSLLKLFKIDIETCSQVISGLLLIGAAVVYALTRPRKRDAFFDLKAVTMIRFPCPACRKRLKAAEGTWGRKASCPRCGEAIIIPPPPSHAPASSTKPSISSDQDSDDDSLEAMIDSMRSRCPTCDMSNGLGVRRGEAEGGGVVQCDGCDSVYSVSGLVIMTFPCPKCRRTLRAPQVKAGARTRCNFCSVPVEVPLVAAKVPQ